MKRRTLIRELGAVGIASTAIAGTTAAAAPSFADLEVDRPLDVSSVEGTVTLDELLEPRDLAGVPGDAADVPVVVAADADVITLDGCCQYCCDGRDLVCEDHCDCCTCGDDCF